MNGVNIKGLNSFCDAMRKNFQECPPLTQLELKQSVDPVRAQIEELKTQITDLRGLVAG